MRRVLAILALLAAAWCAVAVALFVFDHDDDPFPADAVVVLQGSDTRLPVGLELVEQDYAPLLVVSRGSRAKLERRVCEGGAAPVEVICFRSTSTRGEARYIRELARKRDLRRLDVVTSQFHVLRARLVVDRCFDGELRMVGSENPTWRMPWVMVTETAKLAYQLVLDREC